MFENKKYWAISIEVTLYYSLLKNKEGVIIEKLELFNIKKNYYSIDNNGRIFSNFTNSFMSPSKDNNGYLGISLRCYDKKIRRFQVHRLVMIIFNPIENMENLQVNHIDGNKQNNNINNLEWCTCSYNHKHAFRIGLKNNIGLKLKQTKLTDDKVIDIFNKIKIGEKTSSIAKEYNISIPLVNKIKNGERYNRITLLKNTRKYKPINNIE